VVHLLTPFARAETYRRLLFLVSALPLGLLGLVALVAGWTVTLVFAITPLVVPLLVGLRFAVGQLAWVEGALARSLLGVPVEPPRRSGGGGFWRRAQRILTDAAFWRQQAYLLLRVVLGWPLAIVQLAVLSAALWLIGMPIYYRWLEDTDAGIEAGLRAAGWRIDTLPEALLLVPPGLVLLLVALHLARPLSAIWRRIASRLLGGEAIATVRPAEAVKAQRRRALALWGAAVAGVSLLLIVIWAVTTRGGFWPIHAILPLLLPLGIASWVVYVLERPDIVRRTGGSRALALHVGISAVVWAYLVLLWGTEGGYFWPVWPLIGLGVAAAAHAAVVFWRRELNRLHRIEELETTRAGAVDIQETELRRIERDLHDGAQARLIALGMNLGMAEEKLRNDPEGAQALLAEARSGAREALQELRALARGIHPPILTDRGLEAAIAALVARSPVPATLTVELRERHVAAVETAAYFVVAEALANAIKYSDATRIDIRIGGSDGMLLIEIADDGRGGADPSGNGLTGLKQRVGALDGTLRIESPVGGPTTVRAELPCE
jgi:signal transduction histidine kinase